MKKQAQVFLCLCFIGVLGACNPPARPISDSTSAEVAARYQTVSAMLTATAQVTADVRVTAVEAYATRQATPVSLPSPRATVRAVNTPSASRPLHGETLTPTFPPDEPGVPAVSCDQVLPGRPIDVTVPDETIFSPGQPFSKTWRLVNAGGCVWNREYALVWFSGDDMSASRVQMLNNSIAPGQSLDVTVDMVAPLNPGVYQGNWKLRSPQGALFGIGPGGLSPFWVRIVVAAVDTPTVPPPTPEATATPAVYLSETLFLMENSAVDLDSGQVDQGSRADLVLRGDDFPLALVPENGARLSLLGMTEPGLQTCLAAPLSSAPVALEDLYPGAYLCYRTSESLPGRMLVLAVDLESRQISLEFITWLVP